MHDSNVMLSYAYEAAPNARPTAGSSIQPTNLYPPTVGRWLSIVVGPVPELVLEELVGVEIVDEVRPIDDVEVISALEEEVKDVRLADDDVEELGLDVIPMDPVEHNEAGGAEKGLQEPSRSVPVLKSSFIVSDPLPLTTSILAEYDKLASGI